jgi:hypothetical protein
MEPTDPNLDVLFFNGTEWETLGWELNFGGSSDQWETASFGVPEWSRGTEAQIMFRAFDFGQVTDPTVYLRNIGSNTAPVPEPATILLLGTGLVGLIGFSRKKIENSFSTEAEEDCRGRGCKSLASLYYLKLHFGCLGFSNSEGLEIITSTLGRR